MAQLAQLNGMNLQRGFGGGKVVVMDSVAVRVGPEAAHLS
jgi:hypothetical protein